MKIHTLLIALIIFLIGSSCKESNGKKLITKSDVKETLLIKNVNVFNGKDSALILKQDVLLKNGLITQIKGHIDIQDLEIKVINAEGKTLMPGLIDAHVHLSGSGGVPWASVSANESYNLAAYLYAGITTVYDLGGLAGSLSKLAKKVETNKILGPDIYNTHIPITVKNSHPIPLTEELLPWPLKHMVNSISPTIDNPIEAQKIIRNYLKKDVDYVKISCDQIPSGSAEMSFEQMKALIDEAHKYGKKVFVHIGSPQNAIDAVKAGADVLAHGVWRGKLSPGQADTIANSKIPVIYTIAGFQNVNHICSGAYQPTDLDKYLVPEEVLDPVSGKNGLDVHDQKVMGHFFNDVKANKDYWRDNFKLLHDRGVPILVGTDSNLPGTYAGATYFQEIHTLKQFGMSNYEILKAATYLNSKLFLDNPDFGTVEVGKKANLLLIDGNPLEQLDLVKNPTLILLNGCEIKKI